MTEKVLLRVEKGSLVPHDHESTEQLRERGYWAVPVGFPNWVEVSRDGVVRILKRKVKRGALKMTVRAKTLKQRLHKGYALVQFRMNGESRIHRVHRLVMLAHGCGNGKGLDVNHKNGIRDDNRIENLEWATRSENHLHAYRVLKRKPAMLDRQPHNKGKHNDPRISFPVIGESVSSSVRRLFPSIAEAARTIGVTGSEISHVLAGRRKTAGGYRWMRP